MITLKYDLWVFFHLGNGDSSAWIHAFISVLIMYVGMWNLIRQWKIFDAFCITALLD